MLDPSSTSYVFSFDCVFKKLCKIQFYIYQIMLDTMYLV